MDCQSASRPGSFDTRESDELRGWVILPSCHLSPHTHTRHTRTKCQAAIPEAYLTRRWNRAAASSLECETDAKAEPSAPGPHECQENRQRKCMSLCACVCADNLVCIWVTLCTQGWERAVLCRDPSRRRVIETKCLWKREVSLHLLSIRTGQTFAWRAEYKLRDFITRQMTEEIALLHDNVTVIARNSVAKWSSPSPGLQIHRPLESRYKTHTYKTPPQTPMWILSSHQWLQCYVTLCNGLHPQR